MFVVTCTIAGLLRPGYSPLHQAISDLGVGSVAWLLNISVVAMGVLLIGCCAAFLRVLGPTLGDPWRWVCSGLLALPGLGFAWAGIFTEAPATVTLHWVVGMPLVAIGSIAGFLITGIRLRRLDPWASLASLCGICLGYVPGRCCRHLGRPTLRPGWFSKQPSRSPVPWGILPGRDGLAWVK
jgi:hypothetical membrane protein